MKEAVTPVHATREEAAPLLHVFNYIHPLSAATEEYLVTHLYPNQLKRGTILHEQGRVCGTINFIKSGALRGYIIEGKKETTTWISVENETAAAVFSFNMQQPSIENIQVIEDCELLGMSYADLHRCYDLHADFNIAARRMYEKYYADAEVRALIARLSKAEMKYEYFLKTYSHLSNRIPLKYIASFLGINMATLSRIRSLKKPAASL